MAREVYALTLSEAAIASRFACEARFCAFPMATWDVHPSEALNLSMQALCTLRARVVDDGSGGGRQLLTSEIQHGDGSVTRERSSQLLRALVANVIPCTTGNYNLVEASVTRACSRGTHKHARAHTHATQVPGTMCSHSRFSERNVVLPLIPAPTSLAPWSEMLLSVAYRAHCVNMSSQ